MGPAIARLKAQAMPVNYNRPGSLCKLCVVCDSHSASRTHKQCLSALFIVKSEKLRRAILTDIVTSPYSKAGSFFADDLSSLSTLETDLT